MIARLTGRAAEVEAQSAVIDCGGVGYLVQCSAWTLGRMSLGEVVTLHVVTEVRQDAIVLFGFAEPQERTWFQMLTTVQGVGGRVALALLSVLRPAEIAQAIVLADKAALTRADGVGPKLALRLLTELKDRAAGWALPVAPAGRKAAPGAAPTAAVAGLPPAIADALSALVNLGYGRAEAFAAVSAAATDLGPDAGVERLVPRALKDLSA